MRNSEAKRMLLAAGFEIIKSTNQFDCFCFDDDLRVVVAHRGQVENPHTTREVEMMLRRAEVRKAENAAKKYAPRPAPKKETPLTAKIAERIDAKRAVHSVEKQVRAEPEPTERICVEHGVAKRVCAEKGLPHTDAAVAAPAPAPVPVPQQAPEPVAGLPAAISRKLPAAVREKIYQRIVQIAEQNPRGIPAGTVCDILDSEGYRFPSGDSVRHAIWQYIDKINLRREYTGMPALRIFGAKGSRKTENLPAYRPPVVVPPPTAPVPHTNGAQTLPPVVVAPPPPVVVTPPVVAAPVSPVAAILGMEIPAVVHQLISDPSMDDATRLKVLRIVAKLPTSIELMMDDPDLQPTQKLDVIRTLMVKK